MKLTDYTRGILKYRRYRRKMEADDYKLAQLEVHSEKAWDELYEDVQISPCGKAIFFKTIKA